MTMEDRIEELRERRAEALKGGGEDRIERQHEKGKMTARERIDYFLDDGTFNEFDQFRTHRNHKFGMEEEQVYGDGVVTGYGEVNGRKTFVFAHDFTVFGGSLGEVFAEKVCKVMDKAMQVGAPVIGLNDSAGARIQEGVTALGGYAEIFRRNQEASGVVPQVSAIMGPCAGGAVYSPAMTDFTFMVKDTSHMFITGPDVVETVTGEEVSFEELGGAVTHAKTSGVAHFAEESEKDALDNIRRLLSYLPQNNVEDPPRVDPWDDPERADESLNTVVPDEPRKPYDIHDVLSSVVDEGSFFEVHEEFAKNISSSASRDSTAARSASLRTSPV
jgi:Acetyl-CoA carboxylase, carboxyltransferase component (subunits alpha and beta)